MTIEDLWAISWIVSIALILASSGTKTVEKTGYESKGINRFFTGYKIKEIKEAILLANSSTDKRKLKMQIVLRWLGWLFFLATLIIVLVGSEV